MLYFTIQNRLQAGTSKVSEAAGARWRFYRRISSDILGLSSDYGRIVFLLAEALQGVSAQILSFKISWQAQYLVRLEGDLTCSAHWKWRFICDADHWWHWFCVAGDDIGGSFCVAGAVFGEVGGWLFVTGAALRDILGDSRDAKCCILQYKIVSKMGRVRSPKRRVRDDDFIVGYRRIILGLWSNRLSIGGSTSGISAQILTFKISWQAQYLVRLEGDLTGSAHWKWRFICDADHWWHWFCVAGAVFGEVGGSFCVAGAVFGEVGGWLFVTGAALRDILGDSRDAKCCILQYKIVSKMGRVRSPKRRVRDDDFIVGYRRISSDVVGLSSNRLSIGGSIQGVSAEILSFKISWQAQYLVRLDGDFTCLHALEMRLHMWGRSLMTCILRGRRSIWWGCRVPLLAPRIGNEFHMWRRSLMTCILRGRRSIWWGCRVTLLAPRIVNDVSYVCSDVHFVVAGAAVAEVAGCLRALEMTFHSTQSIDT